MEIEGEDNSGLDGCRIINDVTVEADHPLGHNHSAGLTNSDAAYAQWNGAQNDYNGEDWFGEALDLRMGKYREKLKQDVSFTRFFSLFKSSAYTQNTLPTAYSEGWSSLRRV